MLGIHQIGGKILLSVLLMTVWEGHAQNNLVPNPGFENITQCPNSLSQISLATPWDQLLTPQILGSASCFHTCGSGGASVPNNWWNSLMPAEGNGYGGFHAWTQLYHLQGGGVAGSDQRNYLQVPLSSPMVAGHVYKVSFKASYAEFPHSNTSPPLYTDMVGVHFGISPPVAAGGGSFVSASANQPMATIPSGSWGDISFDYTATGGEQYMIVGNFKTDITTTFIPAMPVFITNIVLGIQVFVDKFWVNAPLILSNDTIICQGESATLTASNSNTYAWAAATAPNSILSTNPVLTVSPTVTSTYFVYGDDDTASITVTVKPTPTINLGPDTTLCQGNNLLLIAYQGGAHVAGTQYLWHNGNSTPFFTPTQSGTYWVSASLNGCTDRDTVHVTLNPSPAVNLGNQAVLCEGQSLILNAFFPNAAYLWQDNSFLSTYTVTQAGTYSVKVRLGNCVAGDSITVTQIPLPVVDLGNDTALCADQTLLLTAAQPGATYLWQDHSGNATFTVHQGGLYWVEVNMAGCTSRDSLNVVGYSLPPINLGNDTLPCMSNTLLLDATGPGLSYLWQDNSQLATHTVTQSGTYSVQVTDANGCHNSDAVTVTFIQAPQFNFVDSTLCKGDVWMLDVTTPAAVYLWQDKSVLPTYSIHAEGTYWATVSNPCGSVSDTIEVQSRRCDCFLYVPNSFTPNDDYRNEEFLLTHNTECALEQYTFSIFNRWGQLIFETGNIEFLWDGTHNGKILPMDVYVYRMEYKFDKGPLSQQWGHVNLIR